MALATIKRGSLFLTDDFIQAMTYNVPAQISGFALLKLPIWAARVGLKIDAAELGLAAGIVDPNVILPAVFSQYWQNLCAYARAFHSELNYGEDIEDFSEQAFWKMITRLSGQGGSKAELAEYVLAKSNDVVVNTNTVDGNMYMEILLSVNSKIAQQSVEMTEYKPTYLQTCTQLPSTPQTTVLGGNALALYDKDTNVYNLSEANCLVATFANVDESEQVKNFAFNAILLYYKVDAVEQVAGIYFPNAFEQTDTNIYVLPDIQKSDDVSIGYSINIRYRAGEQYTYTAVNADTGIAMQVYNKWYHAMTAANLQLASMSGTAMQLQKDVDDLKAKLDDGFITNMYKSVQKMEAMLRTTYKGSVSTNRLLELFLAAKQNQGNLALTLMLSDLSKTITSRDITVSNAIGGYKQGDVIEQGSSITDVLAKMFRVLSDVQYTQPLGNLTANATKDTLYVAYHFKSRITFLSVLNAGDSGGFTYPGVLVVNDTNSKTAQRISIASATMSNDYTPSVAMSKPIVATLQIAYAEGAVKPEDKDATDKVYAGILELQVRIVPKYTMYFGSVQLLEDLENLTANEVSNWASRQSNEVDVIYGSTTNDYQCIAIPSDADCPITNTIAGVKTGLTIGTIEYTVYCVKTRYIAFDTTNLK